MYRFRAFLLLLTSAVLVASALVAACGSIDATTKASVPDGSVWDAARVDPLDGGASDGGAAPPPAPSCTAYCSDVLATCTGDDAQYADEHECLALCARLPAGALGDKEDNTVACRAYHAGTTAKTDTRTWCVAAGPFGGGVCGDRCDAFCQLALAICTAPGGTSTAPWRSQPDCATACAGFAYRDGGVDGGGEGLFGPDSGDTLNCRLHQLREALHDTSRCAELGEDSSACQ